MKCPACGNRPLTFSKWLRTLNPLRIQCGRCNARLNAGPIAYAWTLCHVPIAAGLVAIRLLVGPWFLPLALGVLFCTAYVIPYFTLDGTYRIAPPVAN